MASPAWWELSGLDFMVPTSKVQLGDLFGCLCHTVGVLKVSRPFHTFVLCLCSSSSSFLPESSDFFTFGGLTAAPSPLSSPFPRLPWPPALQPGAMC